MPKNIKTQKERSFANREHLAFSFPQLNRETEWEEKCLVKSIQERIHSSPTEGNQSVESRLQLQWHQHDSGQFSQSDPRHGAGETCLRHFSGLTESPWECLTLAGRPGDRGWGWWSWWSTTSTTPHGGGAGPPLSGPTTTSLCSGLTIQSLTRKVVRKRFLREVVKIEKIFKKI